MRIALKECYPIVPGTVLERDGNGEVYSADNRVYAFAREQMLREKEVTGRIFNRGFRLAPIVMCSEQEDIAADGEHFHPVRNLVTLMERLDEKGVSLGEILRAKDCPLTVWDMIRIMIQVLASLKEVHEAGPLSRMILAAASASNMPAQERSAAAWLLPSAGPLIP